MNKTNKTELFRSFLIQALPEPLTRASSHIQLFDNYIPNTRMRLRSVRNPDTRIWTRVLQQRLSATESELTVMKVAEIFLNEEEYEQFRIFEGLEVRKNRYFHEFDGKTFGFDVYLGGLWGLNTARIEFGDAREMREFDPPRFLIVEITDDPFFAGESLVTKTFAEIEAEVLRLGVAYSAESIDEEGGKVRPFM